MNRYYSIIDTKILLKKVNFHPIFSYGLRAAISFIQKNNYTIYISKEIDRTEVHKYYSNIKPLSELKKEGAKEIPLNRPLIKIENFQNESLNDAFFQLKVFDDFSFLSAKDLIKSDFCENKPEIINKPYKVIKKPNNGKPKLLCTAPYSFFVENLRLKIERNYDVIYCYQAPKSIVKSLLVDREIIFTSTCPDYLVDEDLLERAVNLKIIATPSTGTTHLDTAFVNSKNLQVISIKTSNVIERIYASSEFSFSLLLAMINKVPLVTNSAKFGVWREQETIFRSNELHGKTIGLIGYGRIGKKMSRFSKAFGMEVMAHDPFVNIEDDWVKQVNTRDELLENSDIVSLHYHLTPETEKSFTIADFSAMKNDSFFLNTARGELVDELAMIESLKNGKLKAAAVDVITQEHLIDKRNHSVIKYARENDNLIVSPHVAGLTVESESKAAMDVFIQLEAYLNEK